MVTWYVQLSPLIFCYPLQTYAQDILGDLNNFAVGWTDWNIVLDMKGGPNWAGNVVDAPIIAEAESGDTFYKQPMYYYLGHFTKFLPPG
jgi:glucosylceramidase